MPMLNHRFTFTALEQGMQITTCSTVRLNIEQKIKALAVGVRFQLGKLDMRFPIVEQYVAHILPTGEVFFQAAVQIG